MTIAVDDPLLPDNSITVAITGDGAERTDLRPQLHVGIAGLAAVLLGGATWHSLAIAGLARADNPADLVAADRLFAAQKRRTRDSSSSASPVTGCPVVLRVAWPNSGLAQARCAPPRAMHAPTRR